MSLALLSSASCPFCSLQPSTLYFIPIHQCFICSYEMQPLRSPGRLAVRQLGLRSAGCAVSDCIPIQFRLLRKKQFHTIKATTKRSSGYQCPLLRLLLPKKTFTVDSAGYEQSLNSYWYVDFGKQVPGCVSTARNTSTQHAMTSALSRHKISWRDRARHRLNSSLASQPIRHNSWTRLC